MNYSIDKDALRLEIPAEEIRDFGLNVLTAMIDRTYETYKDVTIASFMDFVKRLPFKDIFETYCPEEEVIEERFGQDYENLIDDAIKYYETKQKERNQNE